MKTKIFLIVLLGLITLKAQSILILGVGTTMEIGASADLCAGSIEGSGQILGSGTFCGNPTEVESETDSALPIEFALNQNFPNPFNPSTKISYSIPTVNLSSSSRAESREGEFVTLKVYDILGNEVATLVNEEKPAGSYEITFDASGLSSGIYFYKLSAGAFTETKKMTVLK